jgi:hypothetical protein
MYIGIHPHPLTPQGTMSLDSWGSVVVLLPAGRGRRASLITIAYYIARGVAVHERKRFMPRR